MTMGRIALSNNRPSGKNRIPMYAVTSERLPGVQFYNRICRAASSDKEEGIPPMANGLSVPTASSTPVPVQTWLSPPANILRNGRRLPEGLPSLSFGLKQSLYPLASFKPLSKTLQSKIADGGT
jgi:hypothetical protein